MSDWCDARCKWLMVTLIFDCGSISREGGDLYFRTKMFDIRRRLVSNGSGRYKCPRDGCVKVNNRWRLEGRRTPAISNEHVLVLCLYSGKYLDSRQRLEGRGRFQMFTYIFNAGIVSNVFRYLTTAQSLRMVATLFLFFYQLTFDIRRRLAGYKSQTSSLIKCSHGSLKQGRFSKFG